MDHQKRSKQDLFCWHCLRLIRWIPNPLQVQDLLESPNRMQQAQEMMMHAHGNRELGPNPFTQFREEYLSFANLSDGAVIIWKEKDGVYIPHCYFCERSLLHQERWSFIQKWIKFPLIVLVFGLALWIIVGALG